MRLDKLDDMQLDALRELGGIGAGHAATALSQLVDRPVEITVPEITLLPVEQVPGALGGPERPVAAAYSRLLGEISGSMLFVAPESTALALMDNLHGREASATGTFGHEEEALFVHVAYVLSAAYVAAIARMAGLNVLPAPPQFALDMAGAILQIAVARIGMRADTALFVRTLFMSEQTTLDATLFFLPDPDSLEVMLSRLGLA